MRAYVKMEDGDLADEYQVLEQQHCVSMCLLHAVRIKGKDARSNCLWREYSFWAIKYREVRGRMRL